MGQRACGASQRGWRESVSYWAHKTPEVGPAPSPRPEEGACISARSQRVGLLKLVLGGDGKDSPPHPKDRQKTVSASSQGPPSSGISTGISVVWAWK